MKAINPHTLFSKPKEENLQGVIPNLFNSWEKLCDEKNVDKNLLNAFVAGFFLASNYELKRKVLELSKPEKFDGRVW